MEKFFGNTEDFLISPPPSPPPRVLLPNAHLNKIVDKAYRDAVYDFYKHAFKHQFVADFMEDGTHPVNNLSKSQLELLDKAASRLTTKPRHIMLTINPRPEVKLKEFQKAIEKFVSRKIVAEYMYVYEVRGEDTGMHAHLLLRYTCKPYDFKRAAKNTFKNVCDASNPQILNIRYVKEEDLSDKMKYLEGNKQKSKLAGVEHTKKWRIKNKLKSVYLSEQPLGTPQVPLLGCAKDEQLID